MIERYNTPEMSKLWSLENKYSKWLEVEIAICRAWNRVGVISDSDLENIEKNAAFDPARIAQLEETVRHDLASFVKNIQETTGESGRFIHYGVTSSDILDTATAMIMRDSLNILDRELQKLMDILQEYAIQFRDTVSVGRTHGVHAEPTSFGLKFLLWMDDFSAHQEYLKSLIPDISTGKISGAIGTYSTVSPEVEKYALESLNLSKPVISTQIIQRERHARYVTFLAILGATIEKTATELRNLQRTEVREVMEGFGDGQKGSSAMPHKKNPISAENLCGLSRVLRGYALTSMENITLWHERDLSHSSAERIILADASTLTHYIIRRLCSLLDGLAFYEDRIFDNLNMTRGLLFSQRILLSMIDKGMSRDAAYSIIQRAAIKVWNNDTLNLYEELAKQDDIKQLFTPEEFEGFFETDYYLKHINEIYARFGL